MTSYRWVKRSISLPILIAIALTLPQLCAPRLCAMQSGRARGDYRNPVLFSDYSDPDILRVGNSYYLVASSFHFMPAFLSCSRMIL